MPMIERRARHSPVWLPYKEVSEADALFWLNACQNEDRNRFGHYGARYRIAEIRAIASLQQETGK